MGNIIKKTTENAEQIFTICIDNNGYYTTENTNNLVQVKKMPSITNVKQLLAYKYNEKEQVLEVDEAKLAEINNEVANTPTEISAEERLIALENAFMELTAMTLGGGVNG